MHRKYIYVLWITFLKLENLWFTVNIWNIIFICHPSIDSFANNTIAIIIPEISGESHSKVTALIWLTGPWTITFNV